MGIFTALTAFSTVEHDCSISWVLLVTCVYSGNRHRFFTSKWYYVSVRHRNYDRVADEQQFWVVHAPCTLSLLAHGSPFHTELNSQVMSLQRAWLASHFCIAQSPLSNSAQCVWAGLEVHPIWFLTYANLYLPVPKLVLMFCIYGRTRSEWHQLEHTQKILTAI